MFRRTISVLITAVLLLLPEAREVLAEGSAVRDLELVNQQLRGKVAEIELTDGSRIKKAKNVVVEPNFIYWQAKGKEQETETARVLRIQARSKSRALIWSGSGAALGGLGALASGSGEADCNNIGMCTEDASGASFVAAAGLGALVGFVVGKLIPRKQKLVYEEPGSPIAEPAEDQTDANRLTP